VWQRDIIGLVPGGSAEK